MEQKKRIQLPYILLVLILTIIVIGVIVIFVLELSNNQQMISKTDIEMETSNLVVNSQNTINSIPDSQNNVNDVQNVFMTNTLPVAENNVKKVLNNGGEFVKYGYYIYYWRLNDSSREDVTLYSGFNNEPVDMTGIYSYNNKAENELIKRTLNGTETVLLKGAGNGKIFIMNERIFVQGGYDSEALTSRIYSVDLLGKDKKEYKSGEMKFQIDDDIICEANGEIFTINTKTGEVTTLKTGAELLDRLKNKIYYVVLPYYNAQNISIGYIENNIDKGIVAKISRTEFKNIDANTAIMIMGFWEEKGLINLNVGYRGGSANLVQEKLHVTMNLDGSNIKSSFEAPSYSMEAIDDEQTKIEDIHINDNMIIKDHGIFYKGNNKLVSEADIQKKFNLDIDGLLTINSADIIDNEIYMVIDHASISEADSIGWRTAHRRDKTIACIYNVKDNTYTKIYEF